LHVYVRQPCWSVNADQNDLLQQRNAEIAKMKVRENFSKLIDYLCKNPEQTTVESIVAAGVLNSRDAYDALQYGVRNGVILRTKAAGVWPKGRALYRWTGHPFPAVKNGAAGPSFDALLTAWGIARVPPCIPGYSPSRRVSTD
jgi:hypothetical protein